MTLFFDPFFQTLAVVIIHFCYCKGSKLIFIWSLCGSVWSSKYLDLGQKLASACWNVLICQSI